MPQSILAERWFAITYNWPPEVTRRQSIDIAIWFPVVEAAEAEVARMKEREAERKSRHPRTL
jgi:hypothetical protein